MKKGESAGVWTGRLRWKMTLTKDGQKYELEDYWYKSRPKPGWKVGLRAFYVAVAQTHDARGVS